MRWPLVFALVLATAGCCWSVDILFIAPTPSVSHALPINAVIHGLLNRGHRVTHITPDPMQLQDKKYTVIDLSASYPFLRQLNKTVLADTWPMKLVEAYHELGVFCCTDQLKNPALQEWLKSDHRFDLVIIERLPYQCYYGVIHKVGSPPMVGFLTLPAMVPVYYAMGNPINPAYLPDVFIGYTDHMNFWQRLYNTYFVLRFLAFWQNTVLPTHEAIMREHFGPEPPSVYEVERNYSLLILAVHSSGDYPRPNLPNVIEVTGLHVQETPKPPPQDIKKFMDEAKHGVIYFNLGSNVNSSSMPEHRRQAFIDAFKEIPQRVVWKWEDESIPDIPENVLVRKWLPQQGILDSTPNLQLPATLNTSLFAAHPNVKLFIMQGGLQSLNEAAYRAIPLIAIPFFSDQTHNCAKINSAGIGVRIYLKDITKETVLDGIHKIMENSSYKENMKKYSEVFREHRATSLDTTIWWLEYIIRHKGAPHLRSAALDLHWWQLMLVDVIGFILAVLIAAVTITYIISIWLVARVRGKKEKGKRQ